MKNKLIIEKFKELIEYYKTSPNEINQYRVLSYSKTLKTLENHKTKIKSGEELEKLPGVGKSVIEKVNEIIKTKNLKILKNIKKSNLITVLGIGPKMAQRLQQQKINTVLQLKKSKILKTLPQMVQLGVKYHTGLSKSITRKKAISIAKQIEKSIHKINKSYEVIKAGSFLDNKKILGDIDIIITSKNMKTRNNIGNKMENIINELINDKIILETITKSKNKVMAITKNIHHLDLHLVAYNNLDYHLLYFSGGAEKNRMMRMSAKKKGYKLNEYGLWKDCKKVNISAKKAIILIGSF
jgi:DNA polymerase/3'-5' exonuclease PolX